MTEVLWSPDPFEVSGKSSDTKRWFAVELVACSHILCCVSLLTSECAISKSFPSRAWHWHISNSCWGFVFTSQGCHCRDTVKSFQICLTFNQNHAKASGGMINNFLKVFLNPSLIHLYIYFFSFCYCWFWYSVWAYELFIFVVLLICRVHWAESANFPLRDDWRFRPTLLSVFIYLFFIPSSGVVIIQKDVRSR